MRKFSLALLAMIMVGAMAFAAPIGTEWTLEAEASATFGVNLDEISATNTLGNADTTDGPTTGFAVANEIDLSIEFVEEQTTEFGEGEMYGWIKVEDFEVKIDVEDTEETAPAVGGTNGEISAKVFLGPAYIVIATAENDVNIAELGLNVDESIIGEGIDIALVALGEDETGLTDSFSDPNTGTSVALGFDAGPSNIELVLGSRGSWETNYYNNYVGAILTETSVADLTISVDLAASIRTHVGEFDDSESAGDFGDDGFIGLGVEYEMMLNDMMTLKPYLGLDLDNDEPNSEMDFEIIAGANVEWGADDLEVFDAVSDETVEGVGIEVGYAVDESAGDPTMWVRLGAAESGGDDGLLPVIGGAAIIEYLSGDDLTAWAFGAEVEADLGEIVPYFGLMTADVEDITGEDSGLTMQVGTDIKIIPATTFTLEYSSGDLNRDEDANYDTNQYSYTAAVGNATSKSGTFIIKTKVEY